MQSSAIKDGCQMTLDDEWVMVTYPLAESPFQMTANGSPVDEVAEVRASR
jgi:hypothetical protein